MAKLGLVLGVAVALGVIAVVSSCQLALPEPAAIDATSGGLGPVQVVIDELSARAIVSDADITPVYYLFTATGPEGALFSATTPEPQVKIEAQVSGDWTVAAEAFNAADVLIARGQKTVAIVSGRSRTVAIVVKPIAGEGTLALNMIWDADKFPSAYVQARLNLHGGSVINLAVSAASGTGTSLTSAVPAGKHTLVVKLMNGKVLVVRSSQTVQIFNGATTSGTVELFDIGTLAVGVATDMLSPLEVAISGIVDPLRAGTAMTASGSTFEEPEGVAYAWYLNGLPQASGDQWTFGSDLRPGVYRIDLAAVTADGMRAGSASAAFHVTQ